MIHIALVNIEQFRLTEPCAYVVFPVEEGGNFFSKLSNFSREQLEEGVTFCGLKSPGDFSKYFGLLEMMQYIHNNKWQWFHEKELPDGMFYDWVFLNDPNGKPVAVFGKIEENTGED